MLRKLICRYQFTYLMLKVDVPVIYSLFVSSRRSSIKIIYKIQVAIECLKASQILCRFTLHQHQQITTALLAAVSGNIINFFKSNEEGFICVDDEDL